MRLLKKLAIKFATMVILVGLMGALLRCARPYIIKSAGMPEGTPGVEGVEMPKFASEESDLMATVFKSALRFLSGSAKRDELASELSDQLYAGRGGSATMSELGIELEKSGAKPSDPTGLVKPGTNSSLSGSTEGASTSNSQPGAKLPAKQDAAAGKTPVSSASNPVRDALLARIGEKAKANPELTLIPIVLLGMLGWHLLRRRRSPEDDFMLPDLSTLIPSEAETYDMTHPVHSLQEEDFELLVALIYQRQGYRITMPAGRSGGRGGDFTVQRKSERLLVQCKKISPDYKVPVDRVRELHEAAIAAGATRGVYVATCGFSWDARNFAKTNGMIVINAQTLDTLLTGAQAKPDEDFRAVSEWAPKLMAKVKLSPPLCPACEAPMDELNLSSGPVWVCSERPECRGRRSARKSYKPMPAVVADAAPKEVSNTTTKVILKEPPKTAPTVSSRSAPKALPNRAPKPLPKESPKAAPKTGANGATKTVSNAVLKAVSKAAAKAAAKVARSNRIVEPVLAPGSEWQPPGGRARTVCPSASSGR